MESTHLFQLLQHHVRLCVESLQERVQESLLLQDALLVLVGLCQGINLLATCPSPFLRVFGYLSFLGSQSPESTKGVLTNLYTNLMTDNARLKSGSYSLGLKMVAGVKLSISIMVR